MGKTNRRVSCTVIAPCMAGNRLPHCTTLPRFFCEKTMYPTTAALLEMYKDVLEDPDVRAVGGWSCANHDAPADDERYVAKACADVDHFSAKVDEVLALL